MTLPFLCRLVRGGTNLKHLLLFGGSTQLYETSSQHCFFSSIFWENHNPTRLYPRIGKLLALNWTEISKILGTVKVYPFQMSHSLRLFGIMEVYRDSRILGRCVQDERKQLSQWLNLTVLLTLEDFKAIIAAPTYVHEPSAYHFGVESIPTNFFISSTTEAMDQYYELHQVSPPDFSVLSATPSHLSGLGSNLSL